MAGTSLAGGVSGFDSGPYHQLKPITGPSTLSEKSPPELYVGHGDVPEKVKISVDLLTFGPQRPRPGRPILGNPLGDTFFPIADKPTPNYKPKDSNSDGTPTPAPGAALVFGVVAAAAAGRRRRGAHPAT